MPNMLSSVQYSASFPKLALKLKETADAISVSPITIRRFVDRGLLHPVRAGRHMLFTIEEIRRFLSDSTKN